MKRKNDKSKVDTSKTFVKSIKVQNFRDLQDLDINLGRNLTLITGINGTGKSTILGILAQIFSFQTDYSKENPTSGDLKDYKTIFDKPFESEFKNHFKISSSYDDPSKVKYIVNFVVNDASENKIKDVSLESTSRDGKLRLVLRGDNDRNITFPTIYIDTKRFYPMADRKTDLKKGILTATEEAQFIEYNNDIFARNSNNYTNLTSNIDSIASSTVLSNNKYDINSASTGEDNLGQLIGSLISFVRLKENWGNYKGGLLLIDEIDATLFAKAAKELLELLNRFSSKYNVQIVFTTQSSTVISKVFEMQKNTLKNSKTKNNISINFFDSRFGSVKNYSNLSLNQINNLLDAKPLDFNNDDNKLKVKCVTEDKEGYLFLKTLLLPETRKKVKFTPEIKVGAKELISLVKTKVLEMNKMYVLDGDEKESVKKLRNNNFLTLPSSLPPDQLMFNLMDNENSDSNYWKKSGIDRTFFVNQEETKKIKNELHFDKNTNSYINDAKKRPTRDYFKDWFNEFYKHLKKDNANPIKKIWMPSHKDEVERFRDEFNSKFDSIYSKNNFL